jgi:hypothetical protein
VQVFDFGTTADGRAYFVMELLEGQSLDARLKQRRLDHAECCRIGRQIANVLQAAHAAGITHRDLKPENLYLIPDAEVPGGERVKVLDFGIAKLASEAHAVGVKTRTDQLMGTPIYMSPEQCRGAGAVGPRSDIYSLGCILFEMVCGRPPFLGEGVGEILGAHQHLAPPAPRHLAPDVPGGLAKLILQLLAKPPEERPPTMAAVGEALEEILSSLARSPKLAPTPLPVPRLARPSTTLESAAGTTRPGASPGRRRLPLVLGSVALASVLVMIVVGFSTSDSGSLEPRPAEQGIATEPRPAEVATPGSDAPLATPVEVPTDAAMAVAEVPAVDAAPQVTPDPAQDTDAVAVSSRAAELDCLRHQKSENWSALEICADHLHQINPTLATELKKQAGLESRSASRIQGMEAALDKKDLKRAKTELDQIWTGSRSYERSKLKYEGLEFQVILALVTRLQLAKDASCQMYNQVLASERDKSPPRVIQEATRQVKCVPASPASPAECDHADLARTGLEFHAMGRHDRALQAFASAWNCKPELPYAEKAFITACNDSNLKKAKFFWKQLPRSMQQRVLGVCVRSGITANQLNGS